MYDGASAAILENRIGLIAQRKRALEVDVYDLVKRALIGLLYWAVDWIGCRVINENVQSTVYPDNFSHQRFDILDPAHIGRNAACLQAIRSERLGYSLNRIRLAAADHHLGAKLGKASGHSLTDSLTGASDQSDLSFKFKKITYAILRCHKCSIQLVIYKT